MAYEAIVAFIRARQHEHGYTHPQFWLLRNLSAADLSRDGSPRTLEDLAESMKTYLRPEDDLDAEAATLVDRGWIERRGPDHVAITADGEEARLAINAHTPEIRGLLHDGIDDVDYATTVRVLQRLILNFGRSLP